MNGKPKYRTVNGVRYRVVVVQGYPTKRGEEFRSVIDHGSRRILVSVHVPAAERPALIARAVASIKSRAAKPPAPAEPALPEYVEAAGRMFRVSVVKGYAASHEGPCLCHLNLSKQTVQLSEFVPPAERPKLLAETLARVPGALPEALPAAERVSDVEFAAAMTRAWGGTDWRRRAA